MTRMAKVGEYVRCIRKIRWGATPPEGMTWPTYGDVFQVRELTSSGRGYRFAGVVYPNENGREYSFPPEEFEIVEKKLVFTDILNPYYEWVVVND